MPKSDPVVAPMTCGAPAGLPESALEMNRNLMHVSDLLVAGFCTQTEDAIRAICKRALRRGQRHAGRPR